MDLNQLHYFITVAEVGNITKAAQQLFITQPALSRAISRLEGELDAKLFDRGTNTLVLNENGKVFLRYVRSGLDSINTGVHAVRQKNVNRRITICNYLFLDLFATFCDRCLQEFPDIDFMTYDGGKTGAGYSTELVPDLVVIPSKSFNGYPIAKAYTEEWCITYHPSYTFRSDYQGSGPISIRQLMEESVMFDNSPFDRQIITDLFPTMPEKLQFASQESSARTAISRGQAIGIVPVASFRSLLERVPDSQNRAALVEDYSLSRTVYLSHSPEFLNTAEDFSILHRLDQHITEELAAVQDFISAYFE